MPEIVTENLPITEGYLTVYDNGDYIVIQGNSDDVNARTTYYQRGQGSYSLQLLVERIINTHRLGQSLQAQRQVDERLGSLAEGNRLLTRELEQRRSREASYLPSSCEGSSIPVTQSRSFELGEIPPGTMNCSFSPLYEIFGESVLIRIHAMNPPSGDWGVSLFECPENFAEGGQCDRNRRGKHSEFGAINNDFVYRYSPSLWVSRKVFFRIRNGSTFPIQNVRIFLEPQNRDPLLQMIHDVLAVVGLLPGVGVLADGADLLIYLIEGDMGNAAITAIAMAPAFGDAATVYRIGSREVIRASRAEVQRLGRPEIIERLQRIRSEATERTTRSRSGSSLGDEAGRASHRESSGIRPHDERSSRLPESRIPREVPDRLVDGTPIVEGLRRSYHALARRGVDVTDEYTLTKLNQMYQQFRTRDIGEVAARADMGELRTLLRYADQPDVERVRFLRPGRATGDRTPDIEILRRGQSQPEFVEVRTLTEAGSGARFGERSRRGISVTEESVETKIFRGQIGQGREGTLVFHAPFAEITDVSLSGWQELFDSIHSRRPFPEGLRRIEVTTGGRGMLVFDPPNWIGRRVSR